MLGRFFSEISPATVLAMLAIAGTVQAQEFPSRPIRIATANSAGTIPDIVARTIGPEMSRTLGQPVIVENKPGAASLIGHAYVATQNPADGHTAIVVLDSELAILPYIAKDLRFDALRDLPPVLALVDGRLLLASSGNLPWKTIAELITYAKANPGKLNYGASSPVSRLAIALLTKEVGIDAVFVPYNGSGPYSQALAVGEVHMGFVTDAQAAALKLQVLALTGHQRSPAYPDTPTFAEVGHPRIQGLTYSLRVRSGTPRPAMDKLGAAAARALQNAEVKAQLGKVRLTIVEESPEVTSRRLLESARMIGSIAASSGMQPQ